MTQDLFTQRLATCPLQTYDTREPLHLDDPQSLWWVELGTVDIFAVPVQGGEMMGAREHLYRVSAGQMFFGIATADIGPAWRVVAVVTTGTRLRSMPFDLLTDSHGAGGAAPAVAALVGDWVGAVTRGARKGAQPRQFVPALVGEDQSLAAGQVLCSTERLVFVRLCQGQASWLSQGDPVISAGSALLPLRDDGWMQTLSDCTVQTLALSVALGQPGLWAGLHQYHGLIVRLSLAEFERQDALETRRIRTKAELAQQHMQAGLEVFTRALNPIASLAFSELSSNPQLAACQLVGRTIGVDFLAAPRSGVECGDPIEDIATASGVRFRQVALRGEWWLADGGHLVGKVQESQHAVALLRTAGGYAMHDPQDRSVVVVNEGVAASLVPFAQSFFRALPSRPLGLRDLFAFSYRSIRGDLGGLAGLGLLVGLLGLLMPMALGYVFDALIPASDRTQLVQVSAALVAVAIAAAMFTVARSMAMLRIETRMGSSLQAALWDRALNLPVPFFKRFTSGDLAQRLNAINAIRQALSGATLGTLLASLFSLVNIGLLLYYDLTLGAVAMVLVLGAAMLSVGMGLRKLRHDRRMADALGRLAGLVLEYLRGVTKLRVTGSESRAFANWAREFGSMRDIAFASGKVKNANVVFFSLYQVLVDVAIFAIVAVLMGKAGAASPAMTTGQFIAFYGAFAQVMGAVMGLSETLLRVLNLIPVYERVKPVLEAAPEAEEGRSHPGELQGQIELVGLSFRYSAEGPAVLDNLSVMIRPGSFVAVVGASGSGKSTLLRCLLGFEKPSAGGILFDNQNLADLDARAVRRQMGVVLQHSQVMPGDVFSNIVGTTRLTIDDAWAAARSCGLEADIKAMPMGMHTVISEGGNTLSGGQRQRILIARALVQRPRILLFDEATSALDNTTQAVVTRSLAELRATRVVIAHRLTTIAQADLILVMDKGRIVQRGNYAELMGQPGVFRNLAGRQLV